MRRAFFLIPVLTLLVAGLAAGEDRKEPRGKDRTGATETGKAGKAPAWFNADEFLTEYDRNKDGYLSKDELPERFRHNFDKMDTNKDGKLSREELEKGVAHLQPQRRPSDFAFLLVEMSDCDECCAEELQIVYNFLRKLDTNKNGKIDPNELKIAREGLIKERVDSIFKELDTNKDGKISREEARGHIKRHFDHLDADKDGHITKDELMKAAMEKPATAEKGKLPGKAPAKE